MIHLNKSTITPPHGAPVVLLRMKEVYLLWLGIYKNFPKVERMGIGRKIEQSFLDVLELTFTLSYLPKELKSPWINKAIAKLDIVKFFTQLAWEGKLIPTEKYADFLSKVEEIGRMLGGWKKGLESKTPPKNIGGEKQ